MTNFLKKESIPFIKKWSMWLIDHLPIQKSLKTTSKTSSTSIWPVILLSALTAILNSSAAISGYNPSYRKLLKQEWHSWSKTLWRCLVTKKSSSSSVLKLEVIEVIMPFNCKVTKSWLWSFYSFSETRCACTFDFAKVIKEGYELLFPSKSALFNRTITPAWFDKISFN